MIPQEIMIRLSHLRALRRLDKEGAGDLENQVAEEEYAHAESECPLGEAERREVGLHRELGEADVDAVNVGDHIADEQDREEPDIRFGSGAVQRTGPGRGRHGASSRWVWKKGQFVSRSRTGDEREARARGGSRSDLNNHRTGTSKVPRSGHGRKRLP